MQPMYGSTQRGQPEHVVYVSVGGSTRKRFGENRMGQMALAALGLTMVACLVYSAATEQRHYAAYTPAVGLAQRAVKAGDITKMEMVLAAKEVHRKVIQEATAGAPSAVKAVASQLANGAPTTKLIDCGKIDAYKFLQDTFASLGANITAQNATIFAHDAALEAANTKAYNEWMDAEAKYRTAESAHESAKEAAEYAKGKYDEFTAAVNAGQGEYDETKPGLLAEKEEIVSQQPILAQVKELVAAMANGGGAAAKSDNKAIARKVMALRTSLAETATASTVTKMLAVIDGIISEMETRLQEIGTTLEKMETDLKTNKDSLAHWQQELVDLSDEKDKASNVLNTAALERNTLNGKHTVAEDAYNEYHAGFVDEAETLAKQSKAIVTIGAKIDSAIEQCSAA